jgi:hypothetical protein
LDAVLPALTAEGVLLTQPISDGAVHTILSKGEESLASSLPLPVITDPQKMGSAITYYRRYTLTSLLALAAEDDDANTASAAKPQPVNTPYQTPPKPPKQIETKDGVKTYSMGKNSHKDRENLETSNIIYRYNIESLSNDNERYSKALLYIESNPPIERVGDYEYESRVPLSKLKPYIVEGYAEKKEGE